MTTGRVAHFPGRAAIDAYGNGGFRFADMSHRGSILCLPSGIYAWSVADASTLTLDDLKPVLDEAANLGFLLLGTGATQIFPSRAIEKAFADARLGLDPMSTGSAARTYNVLLAEGRRVAAALIAV